MNDGQLELRFLGETWGLTVGYVVLYPSAQAEAGAQWLAQMNDRRKKSFYTNYAEVVRKPDAKPAASPAEPSQSPVRPNSDSTPRILRSRASPACGGFSSGRRSFSIACWPGSRRG